jgi:single-strand DNA-binding protein
MATRALNKVLLIGNLTRDPEMKYTSSGAALCTFGIATNRSWKDNDGQLREEAEFHNLVAWNNIGEICYQLLAKGMQVYIEGSLRTRSWDDEDGNKRYRTEIKVNEMILLDSKGKSGVGGGDGDEEGSDGEIDVEDIVDEEEASKASSKKKSKKSNKSKSNDSDEDDSDDVLEDDLPF